MVKTEENTYLYPPLAHEGRPEEGVGAGVSSCGSLCIPAASTIYLGLHRDAVSPFQIWGGGLFLYPFDLVHEQS